MFSLELLAAAAALAQVTAPAAPPPMPAAYRAYLPAGRLDSSVVLAPPPAKGSRQYEADRKLFRETRRLAQTPLWALAQADGGRGVLKAFSCAVGAPLNADNAPHMTVVLSRLRTDILNATHGAQTRLPSQRPFLVDKGAVCVPTEKLAATSDYPSDQGAWGWAVGLLLSEIAPDRASPILQRARAYGDSAVICGTASQASVQAGRSMGAAVVAAAHGDEGFNADFAAARREIAVLLASNTKVPDACPVEAELLRQTPF